MQYLKILISIYGLLAAGLWYNIYGTTSTEIQDVSLSVPVAKLVLQSARFNRQQFSTPVEVVSVGHPFFDLFFCNSFVVNDGSADIRVFTRGAVPAKRDRFVLIAYFRQLSSTYIGTWCAFVEISDTKRVWFDPPKGKTDFTNNN